jgi:uncharacterized protein (DUF1778 family)
MKVSVPSRARGTMPIRISVAERRLIEAAAANRPEYVTTFVREAAIEAARRELAGTPYAQVHDRSAVEQDAIPRKPEPAEGERHQAGPSPAQSIAAPKRSESPGR